MIEINETELCNKVLLPYLKSLNINESQITFEKSFSIRLGHTVVDIKNKKRDKISGRLDVLVKNTDGANLFVFELKAPDIELTQDDADQGISYARLLDQIAPFVIVSNGKETVIYDTITKNEIDGVNIGDKSVFWNNNRQLSTQEDLNIRFEALQQFLGYSSDNIQIFCKCQNSRAMKALKGELNNRKYNPKTYVRRESVRNAIDSFISSDSTVFVLEGESGVGKTNELCAITEDVADEQLVLFLNATEISESVEKSLSNEFNWGFSEQINFTEIIKRLSKLGKVLSKRVIIVIDSLDEAVAVNFERSISELASNISSSNGIVKLISSVKTSDWQRFSQFRGNSSPLTLLLDRSWYKPKQNEDPKPFKLAQFNDIEKENALTRYSIFYNLSDIPEGSLRHYCKHPFLLRVVSELYANKKQIPSDLSEEELIASWIQKKLNQIDEGAEQCRLLLISLAHAIFEESREKENATWGVMWQASISNIRNISKISEPKVYNQLESIGFITSQVDFKGIKHYSFYYGGVRDYFLARYFLSLDELSSEKLSFKLPDIFKNSILRSALFWHLRHAPTTQIMVVNSYIDSRAKEYMNTYNDILDNLFPNLKICLPPYTNNEVGVCFINEGDSLEYGLFPVTKENYTNVVKLKYSFFDENNAEEATEEQSSLNTVDYVGGGNNFLNEDPKQSAARRVLKKINQAITNGNLNESNSETILQESVLAIISNKKFLHKNSELYKDMQQNLPIELNHVMKQIQVAFGRDFYQKEWENENNNYQRANNPDQINFSPPPIPSKSKKEIDELILKNINSGKSYPPPNNVYENELKVITPRIKQLSKFKTTISKPILPLPDLDMKPWGIHEFSNYSDKKLVQYIRVFYVKAFEAYQDIVNYNFSKISHKLQFFNKLPLKIHIQVNRKNTRGWGLLYSYQKNTKDKISTFVKVDPEDQVFKHTNENLLIGNIVAETNNLGCTSISSVFFPYDGPGFNEERGNQSNQMPIRSFVYDLIKSDFENIEEEDLLSELVYRRANSLV